MKPVTPTTLEGIKRYAKQIKKAADGMKHAEALDVAARAGGFQNYTDACRKLAAE